MMEKIIKYFLIFLVLRGGVAYAQQLKPADKLTEIALERKNYNTSQLEKARAYAKEHNVPMIFQDDKGNHISLMGVDEFGLPIYWTTLNAGAAISTNVTQLRTGGSLGLNLEGENILVGIWDHQTVKRHAEFDNRIISTEGNEFSEHSTHVTGTILSSGIQSNARGMAPKARATTWNFDNDDGEMASLARPDQTSLLFSNHSYGTVLGWFNNGSGWQWAGNTAISAVEDYRFGFYNSKSRTIDQIAFNAPYYTIVWAAGNDRTDTGDGTRPADGNQGTGYDCISPEGIAKNNITVGAVQKVTNYTGPASVVMSNFSSWGPADDGRIKPDLVGAGVSIFSTSVNTSNNADSYATLGGTSMAAPNVTGSLVLLQELYKDLHAGNFMRSATLKALAIHTAREAGLHPGPDYRFGWGLLDVEAAANVLLQEDQQSVVVQELTLLNNQVFEFNFEPVQNTKVTATIAWTDPPATPVAPQLDPTDRMLVNDLDMRLEDGGGTTISPWILAPINPTAAATKGDNIRDNVEKIEFDSPEPRLYTLRVSHKGQLVNNSQNFSLILTYTPLNDPKVAYYWIGNSGNWNNPANWSLASGGSPANLVPDINSRVIIDERSFSAADQTISLTANATCASVTWLTKSKANFSLNGHTLNIEGNFIISSTQFSVTTAGSIQLLGGGTSQYQMNLNDNDLSLATFYINSNTGSSWNVNGPVNVGGIILQKGGLVAKGITIKTKKLNAFTSDAKVLDISNTEISNVDESILNATNLEFISSGATLNLVNSGAAVLTWTGIQFEGTVNTHGSVTEFSGGATVNRLQIGGTITIAGNNSFTQFAAGPGTTINLQTGSTQTLTNQTEFLSTAAERIGINTSGPGQSTIGFDGHFKLCFDYLDVNNVGLDGDITISAGTNSTLSNAPNWEPGNCSEALFADFTFHFNCTGALTEFTDASDGNITSWAWEFGDPLGSESASRNPTHIYTNATTYTVTLTVSDGVQSKSYSRNVLVIPNNLPSNKVIIANDKLFSELTAEFYQWYRNDSVLENETGRWYEYDGGPGSYFVVIKNAVCSLPSSVFLVSSAEEYVIENQIKVYPNPATDKINLYLPQQYLPAQVSLINTLGQRVLSDTIVESDSVILTDKLQAGLYILDISAGRGVRKRIVIEK